MTRTSQSKDYLLWQVTEETKLTGQMGGEEGLQ